MRCVRVKPESESARIRPIKKKKKTNPSRRDGDEKPRAMDVARAYLQLPTNSSTCRTRKTILSHLDRSG